MTNEIIHNNGLCARSFGKTTSIPLIQHLEETNRLHSTCTCCGKPIFTNDDIIEFESYRIDTRAYRLLRITNNHIKSCAEPDRLKWTLIGIMFNGVPHYRDVCWKCIWKNLRERFPNPCLLKVGNRKLNSWWMRVIDGEDCYPPPKSASIGRDWGDLVFSYLSKEELESIYSKYDTASLSSFKRRFGEEEGQRKYEEYVKFHSNKNKFEYKHEKLGWTKEQFDEFNKSRSVTKDILTNRYGVELGEKKWKEYCDKQAYAGCKLEYFIEKYGEDEGRKKYREVNKMKTPNEDTFVRKYGEEEGKKRYVEFQLHHKSWSNISQELFNNIMGYIPSSMWNKVRYATMGGEDCIEGSMGCMFPDFIYDNNKIIEFNGDYWHRNPRLYSESEDGVKQVWEHDKKRLNELKSLGYDVFVVWEMDYNNDMKKVIKDCVDFLGIDSILV